jgi:hypothetical protein
MHCTHLRVLPLLMVNHPKERKVADPYRLKIRNSNHKTDRRKPNLT